jgi:subtilisin family serine protease
VNKRFGSIAVLGLVLGACSDASVPAGPGRLAPFIQASGDLTAQVVPNEYIVVLKAGSDVRAEAASARKAGGTVLAEWEHALRGYAVRVPESRVLSALRSSPNVDYVEPNGIVHAVGTQSCAPYTTCGWGLDRIDQVSSTLDGSYTFPTNTGGNVHAYIIDTGVRTTHTQFQGRATWGIDAIDGSKVDCNGHGTHVGSTVAGKDYGVAKGAQVVAVRVLDCGGSGSFAQVITGINWVTANRILPAVANMSLGATGTNAGMETAVKNSIAAGVTYAIAAGNSSSNACNFTPARVPEAITVGATGNFSTGAVPPTPVDGRASFSNFGTCLDIFAPGVNIKAGWSTSDNATNIISGTSMATPHVAGAAVLVLAKHGNLAPALVRDSLVNHALSNVVTNPGTGSPNKLLNISFLNGGGPIDNPPNADFSSSCTPNSDGGFSCTFDGSSSTDDNGISSYAWSIPGKQNKSGQVVKYRFPSAQTVSVTLTVTDTAGQTDSITKSVDIN